VDGAVDRRSQSQNNKYKHKHPRGATSSSTAAAAPPPPVVDDGGGEEMTMVLLQHWVSAWFPLQSVSRGGMSRTNLARFHFRLSSQAGTANTGGSLYI
jgi:hypothetical protein